MDLKFNTEVNYRVFIFVIFSRACKNQKSTFSRRRTKSDIILSHISFQMSLHSLWVYIQLQNMMELLVVVVNYNIHNPKVFTFGISMGATSGHGM